MPYKYSVILFCIIAFLLPACAPDTNPESAPYISLDPQLPDYLQQIYRYEAEMEKSPQGASQTIPSAKIIEDMDASLGRAIRYPINSPRPNGDIVIWGPYETLPAGDYYAIYRLRIDDRNFVVPIMELNITAQSIDQTEAEVVAKLELTGKDFTEENRFFVIAHPFTLKQESRVELRLRWLGKTQLDIDYRAVARAR